MPDETTPAPVVPVAAAPRARGYFNQAQIEDLELADTVLANALWPASEELTRPIRKSFGIPQARALGL
jgi:hypothetical protein